MADVVLKAEKRDGAGRAVAKRLRGQDRIPCVLYGHGGETVSLSVSHEDMLQLLGHHVRTFDLDVGGERQHAFVKEIQYNTLGTDVIHVDFVRIARGQRIRVKVPIKLFGHPKGVAEGGVLEESLADIEVECSADAIPEEIRVGVGDLAIGGMVRVSELIASEGVKILAEPDTVVASVKEPRKVEEAAPAAPAVEAAATEPEVIKKPPKEEEAAAEEKK